MKTFFAAAALFLLASPEFSGALPSSTSTLPEGVTAVWDVS